MDTQFQQERWSLHVTFDHPSVQLMHGGGGEIYDEGWPWEERAALERWIMEDFGGLPEEYPEIVRQTETPYGLEVTSEFQWLSTVADWIMNHTIPCEMRLVRNEER